MKIDFSKALVDLDGTEIQVEGQGALTLDRVAVTSLLQGKPDQSGDEKYKRFQLMKRIHGAGEIEVTAEDVSLVKRVIGESGYTALVTGQAWDLLEGK